MSNAVAEKTNIMESLVKQLSAMGKWVTPEKLSLFQGGFPNVQTEIDELTRCASAPELYNKFSSRRKS